MVQVAFSILKNIAVITVYGIVIEGTSLLFKKKFK